MKRTRPFAGVHWSGSPPRAFNPTDSPAAPQLRSTLYRGRQYVAEGRIGPASIPNAGPLLHPQSTVLLLRPGPCGRAFRKSASAVSVFSTASCAMPDSPADTTLNRIRAATGKGRNRRFKGRARPGTPARGRSAPGTPPRSGHCASGTAIRAHRRRSPWRHQNPRSDAPPPPADPHQRIVPRSISPCSASAFATSRRVASSPISKPGSPRRAEVRRQPRR